MRNSIVVALLGLVFAKVTMESQRVPSFLKKAQIFSSEGHGKVERIPESTDSEVFYSFEDDEEHSPVISELTNDTIFSREKTVDMIKSVVIESETEQVVEASQLEAAMQKAKDAVKELKDLLQASQVQVVERELPIEEQEKVAEASIDVFDVLANPEKYNAMLDQYELDRLARRDISKKKAGIRTNTLNVSGFFKVSDIIGDMNEAEKKLLGGKAVQKAAAKLDQTMDNLEQSLFETPSVASQIIAAARLREALRESNLPELIRSEQFRKMKLHYDLIGKLARSTVNAVVTGVGLVSLPFTQIDGIFKLLAGVKDTMKLVEEAVDTAVEMETNEDVVFEEFYQSFKKFGSAKLSRYCDKVYNDVFRIIKKTKRYASDQ